MSAQPQVETTEDLQATGQTESTQTDRYGTEDESYEREVALLVTNFTTITERERFFNIQNNFFCRNSAGFQSSSSYSVFLSFLPPTFIFVS